MTTLRAAVRPMVCGGMTTEELIREARHAFPHPTPIIALMIDRLDGKRPGSGNGSGQVVNAREAEHGVNCPACGAQLHLED